MSLAMARSQRIRKSSKLSYKELKMSKAVRLKVISKFQAREVHGRVSLAREVKRYSTRKNDLGDFDFKLKLYIKNVN